MKAFANAPYLAMLAVLALLAGGTAYGQFDSLGGPYVPDQNTMLLLHFDGNLNNVGHSANGVGHSHIPTGLGYVSNAGLGLGQCLRLVNDAVTDSSYVTVADTNTLDLTGNWTMEGWINIFTFGSGQGDHRWVPRLMIKTGDTDFWRPNYWMEMWGNIRAFQTGFQNAAGDRWPAVTSAANIMTPGQWIHLTFIRDTTRHLLVQMAHNAQRQLLYFGSNEYDSVLERVPLTTHQALHIGWAGAIGIPGPSSDSWLDGFVDEIRISNVVRNFRVPPIITNVTQLPNQPSSVTSYPVTSTIRAFSQGGSIQNAKIRYRVGTNWTETTLSLSGGNNYAGSIPQQPVGSIIDYYVYAVDNNGLRSTIPASAEFDSSYYRFGIFTPNTRILYMPFEQTTGMPIDSSIYHNTFAAPNYAPSFSTDARFGTRSLYFYRDSTHVQANSPFLASEQFAVDFWFKADTLIHATRVLNKEAGNADGTLADDWYHNNYEIGLRQPGGVGTPFRVSGRLWLDSTDAQFELLSDSISIQPRVWYHVMLERNASMTYLQVRDANDLFLQQKAGTAAPPRRGSGLLRIGKASNDGQAWNYIPHYFGKVDNVKVYNYPALGLTGVGDKYWETQPWTFELQQNYPNPFNPATTIRFVFSRSEKVMLAVYDLLGQRVRTLVNDVVHAGEHVVQWNGTTDWGKDAASGVYFYRLESGNFTKTQKMLLLR